MATSIFDVEVRLNINKEINIIVKYNLLKEEEKNV